MSDNELEFCIQLTSFISLEKLGVGWVDHTKQQSNGYNARIMSNNIQCDNNMFEKVTKLIFLCLFVQVQTTTALTNNNCPSNFDVNTANITSASASSVKSLVDLIYSNLYSSSDQATLQQAYITGNTATTYQYLFELPIIAPFIIIGVAFAIAFIIALCCCVFQKACPPCQSWKRDFATRPYEKFQLKCVTIFTVIFALGIAITTIMGFVYFPDLQTDLELTKCSIYYSLDIAINGDQANKWGGFVQLTNQIGNISTLISTASSAASTNLGNSQWLQTNFQALQQQNINVYTNNYLSTVYSPKPTTTADAITPLFISSGLGPYTQNNTMVYDIASGLNVTSQVSQQGYNVYMAANVLANSANNIQTNTNINLQSLSMNSNYYDSSINSVNKFSQNVFDKVFNWALYLIQAVLAFVMVGSILLLLGVLATHFFEIYGCKMIVHLGWVTYGITYFGIVVLCLMFFAVGGLSYSFCQFYQGVIQNKVSFASFTSTSNPTSFNRLFQNLQVCFYGNGSIASAFYLKNQMQTVSSLYSQINTYLSMFDNTLSTYVDLNYSLNKISSWITAMEQYRLGIYVDASSALTTQENPSIALAGMNKYSNNGTGGVPPSCTNDYWVFDSTNCTHNATQSPYNATNSSQMSFASTGFMCISFNSKITPNQNHIWTVKEITQRYIGRRECNGSTQTFDTLMTYVTSLLNYRDSRINLYQSLKDQLNSLLTANTAFNTKINTFTSNVIAFQTATSTLNTLVTNAINGVDVSSNCTTIANSLRFVYNTFCINFLYKSVQFGICCLVLLAIMIGGMLTGSVFGIRYGRIEKDRKIVMPQSPIISHELHSQTFQKKYESSESSSSSDQD